jgi:hypothetical protein
MDSTPTNSSDTCSSSIGAVYENALPDAANRLVPKKKSAYHSNKKAALS